MIYTSTYATLTEYLKSPIAFEHPFYFNGFECWWNREDVLGVQSPDSGYFRCDPTTQDQYDYFAYLQESNFGGYQWHLS